MWAMRTQAFSRLTCLWCLVHQGRAAVVDLYWNITYATANPDGLFERTVIGVNHTWPPPPITVTSGDVIKMHAFNGLPDQPTTLHFHGMFFNGTNFYDGAMGVTQCGIPPGEEFVYHVDTTTQVGTYWVHAHSLGQYVDGLRAPVVILPPATATKRPYDDEFTIVLGDWYHQQHSKLISTFLSRSNPLGAEPVPDSALIYVVHNNTYREHYNENATIPFTPGKTYRLRILNVGALGMFYFKIDGHQMSVIEVDGTDVDALPTDMLSLAAAQRYSVLVTAKNETKQNFLLHANFEPDMFDSIPEKLQLNYTSSIVYTPGARTAPEELFPEYKVLDDLAFKPTTTVPIFSKTKTIELNVFFSTFENGVNRGAFNNVTYVPPRVPTVMTIDSAPVNALENSVIYGPQSNAFVINHLEVVELTVFNWDKGNHPFHLHGQKFQVVNKQLSIDHSTPTYSNQTLSNPMRRDTIQIPGGGFASIRFVADNPGAWMFHCHIEWHLQSGLAAMFIVAPEVQQKNFPVPQFMKDQCGKMNIPFSGNAGGLSGSKIYDLSTAPHGPFPQISGFHARGILSMAACIISSLIGVLTIVWYTRGEQFDEEEVEREIMEKIKSQADKNGRTAFMSRIRRFLIIRRAP
ncbi:hypothetical protein MJO29_004601 [Puccinia striiformis f. sp. tritici]|uniref:hypothetical protein n=3 Tax=Puccinia striiformis f. sp. tritici TaxID=168172 RepID=UPI002008950E|nr:hypothetical protein Pst134EA_007657 [Puccinia striiformis f. sp. tritici]KAH9470396.1 hypothetical protein Pst134EA_007657 [Puccinia striiformis f. sp. tritici]KAI7964174.1 hypothetical protein MJO29_004601 [Puccinia striiformis f. sp. tritici]